MSITDAFIGLKFRMALIFDIMSDFLTKMFQCEVKPFCTLR